MKDHQRCFSFDFVSFEGSDFEIESSSSQPVFGISRGEKVFLKKGVYLKTDENRKLWSFRLVWFVKE